MGARFLNPTSASQVLVDDQKLQTENPDAARRGIDSGPAHAYEMPVRIPGKPPTSNTGGGGTYTTGGSGGSKKPHHPSALAEDSLPVRLRGIKAAYGRALGTAGKLYLDKHASTIGGNPQSAGQAWEHLMKAAEVFLRYFSRGVVREKKIGAGGVCATVVVPL